MSSRRTLWLKVGATLGTLGTIVTIAGYSLKDVYQLYSPSKKQGCVMLDYAGKDAVLAIRSINNLGLIPVIQNRKNDRVKIGTVITQSPEAGDTIQGCTGEVVLQVSADAITTAETPEEYPATPSKIDSRSQMNLMKVLNLLKLCMISALILGVLYLIYKITDLF